jgi:hypothetical protein
VIDAPWQLAVGGDLALPNVPGPRPLPLRIINAYIARLQRAATHDAKIAVAFIRVIHLVAAPASLFSPEIFLRVMFGGGRRGAATDPAEPAALRAGLTLFHRLQTAASSLLARRIPR